MGDSSKGWAAKLLGIALVAGLLAGCASVSEKKLIELMWPEPPQTPRIKFVRTLASEKDLQTKSSFGESLAKFLTGRMPPKWHLYQPMDVVVSDDGQRIYVSDFGQEMVYLFDLGQNKVTLYGQDKPFARPFGLALDAQENLYIVEQGEKAIKVLDRSGKAVKVITHESLERPADITIDRQRGRLYVADPAHQNSTNHYVKVFDLNGNFIKNIGKGKGSAEGQLLFPTYLALDKQGNIYVSDTMNSRISVFDPEGNFLKKIGERGNAFGMFDKPKGVALDSFGNIYVTDSGWSNVQIFNAKGDVLLYFGGRGVYPGLLKNPTGLFIDGNNKIYVADYLNFRLSQYELVNTKAEDSFIKLPEEAKKEEKPAAKK